MGFIPYEEYAAMYRQDDEWYDDDDADEDGGFIICPVRDNSVGCGTTSGYGYSEAKAWKKWDTRVPIVGLSSIYH